MTDSAQKYAIAYFTGKRGWITGSERHQTQDQARQAIARHEREEKWAELTPILRKPVPCT